MRPRTVLVATGAALAMAGVGACGAAGSNASHAAAPAHSAPASPSQRSTSQGAGPTAQTGAGSSGSSATGTVSTTTGTTTTGTGAASGGQDEMVGIWPVTTRAQAIQLQQSADAGHQPWLLDPMQVAVAYARSVMHLSQPNVQKIGANLYNVYMSPGAQTHLTVGQPVRTGSGGIWVVVSAKRLTA